MMNTLPIPESIAEPKFEPNVPSPLLEMCRHTEEGSVRKYILESQSVQSQQIQWLIRNAMAENKELLKIDRRLKTTEEQTQSVLDWKNNLSGKTAVVGGFVLMFVSALFGCIGKLIADKFASHP